MFVNQDVLPENARVWVYPSSRKFYPQELEGLEKKIMEFVSNWKKEDEVFKASFELKYNRFIVFYADEVSQLANKDIDTLVSFVLQLQQDYEIELLDRMNACFKQGEYIQYKDLKPFKKLVKSKSVNGKTIVFNNLIETKDELKNNWEVPMTESWYNRFL